MKISTEMKKICGAYSETLVSEYEFLTLNAAGKKLTLTADADRERGDFDDAYLTVKLSNYSWRLPLEIDFFKCGDGSEAAEKSTDCAFSIPVAKQTEEAKEEPE